VQLQRTYTRLQIHFHQMIGKDYKPKQRPTWAYSEQPRTTFSNVAADEAPKTGSSLPATSDRLIVGSVSDSKQGGAQ